MTSNNDRRKFLKFSLGSAGAALLTGSVAKAVSNVCTLTPAQTAGPFYPGEKEFHQDNDLTQIPGRSDRALGQVVYIRGRVIGADCKPVAKANVEIWQACASGKYNNPNDPNTAPIDPNFKYWGETSTDANGEYVFKTIIPGAYPADTNWIRPPHVHFKVSRLGYHELITQMYFAGNTLNSQDEILLAIPPSSRPSVIVDFAPSPEGFEPESLTGSFEITLKSVRA